MPRIVDPVARRSAFVQASWAVIAAEGLDAATMRRVAAAAGCTTGALTHYFADRTALLVAALRAAHQAAGRRMLYAGAEAHTDLQRLEAVLLEALPLDETRLQEWRVWLAFWGATPGRAELAEEHERRYSEWRFLLLIVLKPLFADRADAEREADSLLALIDGLGVRVSLCHGRPKQLAEARQTLTTILYRYLSDLAVRAGKDASP